MKRDLLLSLFFLLFLSQMFPENGSNFDLALSAEDMVLDEGTDGGYHLRVSKKPALGSVLLTESTKDPDKRLDIIQEQINMARVHGGKELGVILHTIILPQ